MPKSLCAKGFGKRSECHSLSSFLQCKTTLPRKVYFFLFHSVCFWSHNFKLTWALIGVSPKRDDRTSNETEFRNSSPISYSTDFFKVFHSVCKIQPYLRKHKMKGSISKLWHEKLLLRSLKSSSERGTHNSGRPTTLDQLDFGQNTLLYWGENSISLKRITHLSLLFWV